MRIKTRLRECSVFSLSIKVVAAGDYVTQPTLSHVFITMLAAFRLTLSIS